MDEKYREQNKDLEPRYETSISGIRNRNANSSTFEDSRLLYLQYALQGPNPSQDSLPSVERNATVGNQNPWYRDYLEEYKLNWSRELLC
jgi:hypothetical protein